MFGLKRDKKVTSVNTVTLWAKLINKRCEHKCIKCFFFLFVILWMNLFLLLLWEWIERGQKAVVFRSHPDSLNWFYHQLVCCSLITNLTYLFPFVVVGKYVDYYYYYILLYRDMYIYFYFQCFHPASQHQRFRRFSLQVSVWMAGIHQDESVQRELQPGRDQHHGPGPADEDRVSARLCGCIIWQRIKTALFFLSQDIFPL